jgi:hypothetical protein
LYLKKFQFWQLIVNPQTMMALKEAMKEDYSLTHQCNLIISAEDSSVRAGSFLLRKHSPYLEVFNRG